MEELWLYQQENNYDAIFLRETDYIEGKPLGHFKHWKNRMFTNCKNKIQGSGVGTLVSQQKDVFHNDLSGPDLELVCGTKCKYREQKSLLEIYTSPQAIKTIYTS